jgi:hypothetical protein
MASRPTAAAPPTAPRCPWCGQTLPRDAAAEVARTAGASAATRGGSTPPCGGVHPDPLERSVLVAYALMPVLLGAMMFISRGS